MTIDRRRTLGLLGSLGALAAAPAVRAQAPAAYPNKPIKVVLPFPPGGQTDAVLRLILQKAEPAMGQPFVVDNRPGANGLLGTQAVLQAPGDGYTLLFNMTALSSNPVLQPSTAKYDVLRDFTPVIRAYELMAILAVPADLPVKNLAEFAAYAKAARQPLTYGTTGHASSSHYFVELFCKAAGVQMVHVPYKGEAPLLPDLIAGRVQAGIISGLTAKQFPDKLRLLASSGNRRFAAFSQLPTFGEQGIPGVGNESYAGFVAPASTPRAVVERLNQEFGRALALPEVRERITSYGLEPMQPAPPSEFAAVLKRAHDEWVVNAKKVDIKPE